MGTVINRPSSIVGRQRAINKAKAKLDSVLPADSVLSVDTTDRLNQLFIDYNAGIAAIAAAALIYHDKTNLAKAQRLLLKSYIDTYFTTMGSCIKINTIPAAARTLYGLPISNDNLPDLGTDDKLMAMGALVLSADIVRRAAGGIAITTPTVAQFTLVYNAANAAISAISNALTVLTNARVALKNQNKLANDIIKHIWDDAESKYSLLDPSERRVLCRLWGARYISKGLESMLSGLCTDSVTGAVLPNVQIHIMGVGHRIFSDALGNYTINTVLYGDLEIAVKLAGYDDQLIDVSKEDGIDKVLNIVMVKTIV